MLLVPCGSRLEERKMCASLLKKSPRPTPESSSGLRARVQVDLVAQAFEPPHEVLLDHLLIMLIEVVAAQVLIAPPVAQQMVDDDQDAMTNRDGGAFGSAPCGDAAILRRQIGILAVSSGVGGLDQEPARVGVAFARLATEPLARTLMIARTDAHPGRQMFGRGELVHLQADLRQESLGHPLADAGHLIDELGRFLPTQGTRLVRGRRWLRGLGSGSVRWLSRVLLLGRRLRWSEAARQFLIHASDSLIQLLNELEMLAEH